MSGLSVLENGLTFEHIDCLESDAMYEEIFTRRVYLQHEIDIFDGDVVIDAGANIGLFALFCATEASVSVVAVEPIPPVFDVLTRNLTYFRRVFPNSFFHAVNCALGGPDEVGQTFPFQFFPTNPGESTRHGSERSAQRKTLSDCVKVSESPEIREYWDQIPDEVPPQTFHCQLKTLEQVCSDLGITSIDLIKV